MENEFKVCEGNDWPCNWCTEGNCPERRIDYQVAPSELEEMMYERREGYKE